MFFDIGWPELMLVGAVALVVIGPKDLPRALRTAGFWVRKARTLSREFQSSIDQMIRESELEEVRQELKKATDINIESEFHKTVDPKGELAESLRPPSIPDYFDHTPAGAQYPIAESAPAIGEATEMPIIEPQAMSEQEEAQLALPVSGPSSTPHSHAAAAEHPETAHQPPPPTP